MHNPDQISKWVLKVKFQVCRNDIPNTDRKSLTQKVNSAFCIARLHDTTFLPTVIQIVDMFTVRLQYQDD